MRVSPSAHAGKRTAPSRCTILCCTAPRTVAASSNPLPRPKSAAAAGSATSVSARSSRLLTVPSAPDTSSLSVSMPRTRGNCSSSSSRGVIALDSVRDAAASGSGPSKKGAGSVNQPGWWWGGGSSGESGEIAQHEATMSHLCQPY